MAGRSPATEAAFAVTGCAARGAALAAVGAFLVVFVPGTLFFLTGARGVLGFFPIPFTWGGCATAAMVADACRMVTVQVEVLCLVGLP